MVALAGPPSPGPSGQGRRTGRRGAGRLDTTADGSLSGPRGGGRTQGGAPTGDEGGVEGARGATSADPVDVARQICLHQLEFAPRTRAELAAALRRKGVEDAVADEVLGRFEDVGMIDDALFARMWVTSRHRGRGLARRALSQELRRKGVDDSSIAEAMATLDTDQEVVTARALVDRRLAATAGLPTDARVRRLAGLLARKGYPAGLAFRVVKEALADEGQEAELAFDQLQALDEE